jgi:LysR family transcriptional activator of nhaA
MRREIDGWIDAHAIHPRIVGEFDDFALMSTFAQSGTGVFPVPSIISDEVGEEMGIEEVGVLEGVTGRFYAITLEEGGGNEASAAIVAGPAGTLFG